MLFKLPFDKFLLLTELSDLDWRGIIGESNERWIFYHVLMLLGVGDGVHLPESYIAHSISESKHFWPFHELFKSYSHLILFRFFIQIHVFLLSLSYFHQFALILLHLLNLLLLSSAIECSRLRIAFSDFLNGVRLLIDVSDWFIELFFELVLKVL
jgi:hypothetical protein